jgi:hypothetical protein
MQLVWRRTESDVAADFSEDTVAHTSLRTAPLLLLPIKLLGDLQRAGLQVDAA